MYTLKQALLWAMLPVAAVAETDLTVTAERTPLPRYETGSSVSVLSARDLQKFGDVPAALATLPGVFFTRNGGPGTVTSVRRRGACVDQVLVLVDGMRVNDPSSPAGAYDFSGLPIGDIDRIEAVRGPQSALYGGDAVGGVINVITKQGSGPARVSTHLEGGSRGTFEQRTSVSGRSERVDYRVSEQTLSTSGFSRSDASPDNDPSSRKAVSANVGVHVNDALTVRGQADRSYLSAHFDEVYDVKHDQLTSDMRTDAALSADYAPNAASASQLRLYDNLIKRRSEALGAGPGQRNQYDGERVGLEGQTRYAFTPEHALTLGGEARKEHTDFGGPYGAGAFSYNTAAGFVQYAYTSPEGALHVTPGVRTDHNDQFGTFTTGRLAVSYKLPAEAGRWHGSVGSGAKVPALYQLYSHDYGNRNLKPEKSLGEDLGWAFDALHKRVHADVTVFNNDVRRLIGADALTGRSVNINRATTRGLEASAQAEVTDEIGLNTAYTYTDSEDRSTGRALVNVPKHTLSAGASYAPGDFSFGPRVRYMGASAAYDGGGNKSYVTVDFDARYNASQAFGHEAAFFVRVENLLDRRYQEIRSYNGAPFGVFAGVDMTF